MINEIWRADYEVSDRLGVYTRYFKSEFDITKWLENFESTYKVTVKFIDNYVISLTEV